jgi:hypothetical protein
MNSALICSSDNIGSRSESDRPPARPPAAHTWSGHDAGAATRGGREGESSTHCLETRGENGGGAPEGHLPECPDPARTCVLCPPAPGTPGTTPKQTHQTPAPPHSCQSRAAVTGSLSLSLCESLVALCSPINSQALFYKSKPLPTYDQAIHDAVFLSSYLGLSLAAGGWWLHTV